jgi:hypothetical protein
MDLMEEVRQTNQVLFYAKYQKGLKEIDPQIIMAEVLAIQ